VLLVSKYDALGPGTSRCYSHDIFDHLSGGKEGINPLYHFLQNHFKSYLV